MIALHALTGFDVLQRRYSKTHCRQRIRRGVSMKYITTMILSISIVVVVGFTIGVYCGANYVIKHAEIEQSGKGFTLSVFNQVHEYK